MSKTNDTKSKEDKKVPNPEDVPELTIDDVIADHLGTTSNVVDTTPLGDKRNWRHVTYKKITHNQWTDLSKTTLDAEGTQKYYRRLIYFASVKPAFETDKLHEKIDAGFVLNYGKLIEIFVGKMDFL